MLQQIIVYVIGVLVAGLILYRIGRLFFSKRSKGMVSLCSCCPEADSCAVMEELRKQKIVDSYGCCSYEDMEAR